MKFNCDCGYTIRYQTDYLPYKANFIPDQDWFAMLNMISDAIDNAGQNGAPTGEEVTKGEEVTSRLWKFFQTAYQCENCARVYLRDPENHFYCFSFEGSEDEKAEVKSVFRGRQDIRG
jgi:hypothetical protein